MGRECMLVEQKGGARFKIIEGEGVKVTPRDGFRVTAKRNKED